MAPLHTHILFSIFLFITGCKSPVSPIAETAYKKTYKEGDIIDSLNGVYVYFNDDGDGLPAKRNLAPDGYNIGLQWQCVEFVKRYYYQYLQHEMPDSYGNAVDFFDKELADGSISTKRNLLQYSNPSTTKPQVNDLIVFDGTLMNRYGHVAIISKVYENKIEIVQQNAGSSNSSRGEMKLQYADGKWYIVSGQLLGWLRKE